MLWRGAPAQPAQEAIFDFKLVIVDSLIIGFFIGLSIFVAQIMGLSRPYWVPVACIAVLQGINFRAVWTKQLHRIAGTIVGMGLAWLLLSLHLNVWAVCAMMMALSFIIETLVTRHYAAAVIFITPLTIFLAEAGAGVHAGAVNELINARAIDTIIGSVIGLFGGFCLHYLGLRDAVEQQLRKLFHLRKTS